MRHEWNTVITQGDLLADGSVVAVVVSPEDVIEVVRNSFNKVLTMQQAKDYIARYSNRIVDAMLDGWTDALPNAYDLDTFAETHGTDVPEKER